MHRPWRVGHYTLDLYQWKLDNLINVEVPFLRIVLSNNISLTCDAKSLMMLLNLVYLLFVVTMLMANQDFEELVRDHFRRRGYYILKACDAYMKGYLIGSLKKDASVSDESNANANSVGFKLMLAKIVPKLFSALNEVGAYCDEFKHLQQS